jgi:type II secretory pathway pseudopilin PulG
MTRHAQRRRRPRRRHGVNLVDVVITIVLVVMLFALFAPTVAKSREKAQRQRCAENLRMIGYAVANYRSTGKGFPRVTYAPRAKPDVSAAGADAPDPFRPGGPPANNVPAAVFLLLRTQELYPQQVVCPAGDFEADPLGGLADPAARSNFTDVRRNLGYSFLFTYTDTIDRAAAGQPRPVAADLNPGTSGQPPATSPTRRAAGAPPSDADRQGNSDNHGKRGQWVLYDDQSVNWYVTPFAGVASDNIYTTQKGTIVDTPTSDDDTILLPAAK